ncbi:MAG: calcium/proton exchanger [Candidatus Eisenbacteria bacterium]|nr:calcium/proton exchanger [Candidatus Eisenbacteria bacterium]
MKKLRVLLVFVPLAFLFRFAVHNEILLFLASALGLVPLSGLLAEGTEALADRAGPRIGGLLNASLGNAAELILGIFILKGGEFAIVKASITGSILGNLLLILGISFLAGGLRNGRQTFQRDVASLSASMMMLAVAGLVVPTLFAVLHEIERGETFHLAAADPSLDKLSLGVAAALIIVYVLTLIYTYTGGGATVAAAGTAKGTTEGAAAGAAPARAPAGETAEVEAEAEAGDKPHARWSVRRSIGVLAVATVFIAFLSEYLVDAIETVREAAGFSELFLGAVLIPLVGNVAEHLVAVQQAYKNRMDLALAVALESSMQIALFVGPVLVFVSLFFGSELTLFFHPYEVVALGLAALIAGHISGDGESSWLEGAQLVIVYVIIALGFLFL